MQLNRCLVKLAGKNFAFDPWADELKRRAADYSKLLDLSARQEKVAAAEKTFEQLNRKHPVPMNDLVQSSLPGIRADIRPRDPAMLADGWLLRGADVTLDDIALVTAARFLSDAAAGRPPWRATESAVTASGRPGTGRVSLSMEAVEKSGN